MSLICFYTFSFEFIHVMTVTTGFENFFPKNGASKTATGGPKKPSSTGNNNNNNSNNKKSTKDDANSKTKTKKAAFSGSPFGKNTSSSNHNNSEPHPAVLLGLGSTSSRSILFGFTSAQFKRNFLQGLLCLAGRWTNRKTRCREQRSGENRA